MNSLSFILFYFILSGSVFPDFWATQTAIHTRETPPLLETMYFYHNCNERVAFYWETWQFSALIWVGVALEALNREVWEAVDKNSSVQYCPYMGVTFCFYECSCLRNRLCSSLFGLRTLPPYTGFDLLNEKEASLHIWMKIYIESNLRTAVAFATIYVNVSIRTCSSNWVDRYVPKMIPTQIVHSYQFTELLFILQS